MSTHDSRLFGLYVITDSALCMRTGVVSSVAAALEGGARLVQYRDKSDDHERRLREASELHRLCAAHNAFLIINDDIELAARAHAHGVHLGRDDARIERARETLGTNAIIGASCYDDLDAGRAAVDAGASYVAFGSVFPSRVKPDAVRAPLTLFADARDILGVPTCAIGGIDATNIGAVARAGATMAAVISAVFGAPDIRTATEKLNSAFASPTLGG